MEDDCMPPLFCSSNRRRLELASVPCGGTVNHSIFQGGAVQVDVGRIRTVKRHPPFTRYSTRRTVNYLSESEACTDCCFCLSAWFIVVQILMTIACCIEFVNVIIVILIWLRTRKSDKSGHGERRPLYRRVHTTWIIAIISCM